MVLANRFGLPQPIVDAIKNDPYTPGEKADISVTTLISPPRIRMLKKRHKDEIVEDASEGLWRLLGQAVHHILERGETPGHLKEKRLYANVLGWVVSGQFDMLRLVDGVLFDFKVTSVYSFLLGDKPEWTNQMNVLAWILRIRGYDVKGLKICAILRDHSSGKALGDKDYPQIPFQEVSIDLWSHEKADSYVGSRVIVHQLAEKMPDENLPMCTPEERWERPETWAVMKKKDSKRAHRVFEDMAAAYDLARASNMFVVNRKGESVRCARFCSAAPFCEFGKKQLTDTRTDNNEKAVEEIVGQEAR